jgi:hypothetical protein
MRGCSTGRDAHEPAAVLVGGVALALLLVRRAGLAAHRVAHGLRLGRGAARSGGQLQHLAHRQRILLAEHAHAGGRPSVLSMVTGNQLAVAREDGVGLRQLEQRRRQAVAVAHGGLLDRTPGLVGPQAARHRAREGHLRLLAEARLGIGLPHLARVHLHGHLDGADVAGLLDDSLTVSTPCRWASLMVDPRWRCVPARSGSAWWAAPGPSPAPARR